jgi:hypothetical protein
MSGPAPAQQRFIDAHAPLLAAAQDLDKDELICLLMEAQLKVDTLTVRAEEAEEELEEVEEEKESWIDRAEKQKEELKELKESELLELKELKEREKGIMEYEHLGLPRGSNSYERFCQAMCELEYDEKWISELKREIKELKKNM